MVSTYFIHQMSRFYRCKITTSIKQIRPRINAPLYTSILGFPVHVIQNTEIQVFANI